MSSAVVRDSRLVARLRPSWSPVADRHLQPMHFIAALKDVPEVWEISYDPKAQDIVLEAYDEEDGMVGVRFFNSEYTGG